jgi:phosphatidylglycerophosphate synthase
MQSGLSLAILLFCLSPFLPGHLPQQRFGPANQVTLLRAGLAALLAGLVGRPEAVAAHGESIGVMVALMLILDGLDGWLARRIRMQSAFGARFDMEVDAFFILILTILVYQSGRTGAWVLLAGLMRYGFVVCGRLWPWLRRPLPLRKRRQTVCVILTAALGTSLLPFVSAPWATALAGTALVLLAGSFAVDIVWLVRSHYSTGGTP